MDGLLWMDVRIIDFNAPLASCRLFHPLYALESEMHLSTRYTRQDALATANL